MREWIQHFLHTTGVLKFALVSIIPTILSPVLFYFDILRERVDQTFLNLTGVLKFALVRIISIFLSPYFFFTLTYGVKGWIQHV